MMNGIHSVPVVRLSGNPKSKNQKGTRFLEALGPLLPQLLPIGMQFLQNAIGGGGGGGGLPQGPPQGPSGAGGGDLGGIIQQALPAIQQLLAGQGSQGPGPQGPGPQRPGPQGPGPQRPGPQGPGPQGPGA